MKRGWIVAMTVLGSYSAQAQFEIPPYPMEITCEVGFTAELDPPPVYSNCHDTNVNVEVSEEMVSGGDCAGKIMLTYFYKDLCENEATAQVFVTLKDTQEPEFFELPADIQLKRGDLVPFAATMGAYDNSGQAYPVKFSEKQVDDVVIRTWTCTDACGNTAKHTQRIQLPY